MKKVKINHLILVQNKNYIRFWISLPKWHQSLLFKNLSNVLRIDFILIYNIIRILWHIYVFLK